MQNDIMQNTYMPSMQTDIVFDDFRLMNPSCPAVAAQNENVLQLAVQKADDLHALGGLLIANFSLIHINCMTGAWFRSQAKSTQPASITPPPPPPPRGLCSSC